MRVRIPTLNVTETQRKALGYHVKGDPNDMATRHDIRDTVDELWQSFLDNLESEYQEVVAKQQETKTKASTNGDGGGESELLKLMAQYLKEHPEAKETIARELQEA